MDLNIGDNTTNIIGEFGTIYTQFKHKPKEAIKHLMNVQEDECVAALYRDDIGDIDVVWGENDPNTNEGFGLKHIVEKHGNTIESLGFKIEDFIPIIIQYGEINIKKSDAHKYTFESERFRFVVQNNWNGREKMWLLTAFDLRKKP